MDSNEEMIIDLRDMLGYLKKKSKSIVGFGVILAILFSVLYMSYSYFSYKNTKASEENWKSDESLTQTDIDAIENAHSLNSYYKNAYNSEQEYIAESVLMGIDAYAAPTYTLLYIVESPTDGLIESVMTALTFEIKSQELWDQISSNEGVDAIYADELVDISYNCYCGSNTNSYYLMDNNSNTNSYYLMDNNSNTNMLSISVYSTDEASCKRIANIVKASVDKSKNSVIRKFSGTSVILASENYGLEYSGYILGRQDKAYERLSSYSDKMADSLKSLTSSQQEEYNELYEKDTTLGDQENDEDWISLKKLFLGIIGGFVLIVVVYVLKYLLSSTLRNPDDIRDIYKVTVLGRPVNGHNETECIEAVASEIILGIRNAGLDTVYISSSFSSEYIDQYKSELSSRINALGGNAESIKSIYEEPDVIRKLNNKSGIVYVEQIFKSYYKEIEKEVSFSNKYNITIIGCSVVDE